MSSTALPAAFSLALLLVYGIAGANLVVPDAIRTPVEAYYGDVMQDMVDPDAPDAFQVAVPGAMYSRVEVNGDGIPDWRVDYGQAQNPSLFCGTGGCRQELWVSRPGGGYALAFEHTVREIRLSGPESARRLDIDFHGSICDGAGVEACPRRYGWSQVSGRFLERPSKAGTWLAGGPMPAATADLTAVPVEVLAQVERRRAICQAAGGDYAEAASTVNDLPDLNGDGVRDWVVGAAYPICDMGETGRDSPAIPTTILVSHEGGFVTGYERVGAGWGIELGPPARFVTVEGDGCGFASKPCAHVPWRWIGETLVRTP